MPRSSSAIKERIVAEGLGRLRASGLKITPQRIAIVRELADDPSHPTAYELYERLRPAMPTMSFATVYNTLDALASAGLCAARALAPGATRFDPNMEPHDHAVCDRCGHVSDVEPTARAGDAPDRTTIFEAVSASPGFVIRAVEQIYRGLCARCSADSDDHAGASAGRPRRPPLR